MQKKIFYSIISTCLLLGLIANIMLIASLYVFFKSQSLEHLKKHAAFLAPYAKAIIISKELPQSSDLRGERVSIIDEFGKVLYDSMIDSATMQNHSNREEVQGALRDSSYFLTRYSSTLEQDELYYALKIKLDSKVAVLRLSMPYNDIADILKSLLPYFILSMIICLILCLFIAKRLTLSILKPISNINLDNIKLESLPLELHSFANRLKVQNKTIKSQYKDLKQKQQEMLSLIENMSDSLILLNHRGKILATNTRAKVYFNNQERINNINSLKDSIFLKAILSSITSFKKSKIAQSHTLQLNLDGIECEITLSPIYSTKPKLKGVAILIRDISAKLEAQKLRREFSANVTHELKTPLTTILGNSEMIKNNMVDSKDYPHFIDRIYAESKRLLEMIDEILKLSFFDESKQNSLTKKPLDISLITKKVIDRLDFKARQHNIKISLDSALECKILGVEELIENLVYNLCDNAICYNKENGKIDIKISKIANDITLSIKDSGIGIPPSMQTKIFERFFCVDKSRSKKLGGTGLGLSIVKAVAKYHDASISVHSELNEGSEFIITFKGIATFANFK